MKIKKLVIMAGAGNMSLLAIEEAIKQKIDFIIIGFKHISEFNKLKKYQGIPVYETHIAMLGRNLKIMKNEGVDSILFVGKINKVNVFKILKFDLATLKAFLKLKDRGDSTIMQGIVDFFQRNGIKTLSQKEFFFSMLATKGFITKKKCNVKIINNLIWGKGIAKKIAALNIGQSIIIGNHNVISVEGIEGTDNMIKRSKDLLFKDSCFIKIAKQNHNPKYDLPVFGLDTLKSLQNIHIKTIALEAGMVLIPEKEKVLQYANQTKMVIYGL